MVIDRLAPVASTTWGPASNSEAPVPARVMFKLAAADSGVGPSGVAALECRLRLLAVRGGQASESLRSRSGQVDSFRLVSQEMHGDEVTVGPAATNRTLAGLLRPVKEND